MKSLEPWPRGIANGVLSLRDIIYYLSAYGGKPHPYVAGLHFRSWFFCLSGGV